MRKLILSFILSIAFLLPLSAEGTSQLMLPAIFGDHMVLQAGRETACWGKGRPGEIVEVEFLDQEGQSKAKGQATVEASGRWLVKLPLLAKGTAGRLVVSSGGEKREIQDVIVGEVWLASGQSNMRFPVSSCVDAEETLKSASQPSIRLFQVAQKVADQPEDDVPGSWHVADPSNVKDFSALAWNFGMILHRELDSPVGLIQSTWGGTTVATWLPAEVSKNFPELADFVTTYQKNLAAYTDFQAKKQAWQDANTTAELQKANAAGKPKGVRPARPENTPSRCFNAMINGLVPYTIAGVLWYQGESDAARPALYRKLFPAMITGWRQAFGVPELPFFYVELPGYNPTPNPIPDGWAWIRESQSAGLALPKVNVATGIDLGSKANVLHPKNKGPIATRMANLVLGEVYGRGGQVRSPQYTGSSVEQGKVRLKLANAAGLRKKDAEGVGFLVKDEKGQWLPAEFQIEGEDVLVWNAQVSSPAAVRYAWSGSPPVFVENGAGLPLRPFRTDSDATPAPLPAPAKVTEEP